MDFEVRMRKRKWMSIMQIVCVVVTVVIWKTFTSLIDASGSLLWLMIDSVTNNVPAFVAGFFAIALVLPAAVSFVIFSFYYERRPRIKVNGANITFYPLWRLAKRVTLAEITDREVQGDTRGEKIDAAVGGVLLGLANPPLAYSLQQRYEMAQQAPKALSYAYYSRGKRLITISTKRDMENLERFDQMVLDQLAGKTLAHASSAENMESPKKTKHPLILAGLIGIICLAALGTMLLPNHTAPRSTDLLAGTSWLSGDDSSQWVFGTDKTFAWYQMKGQTDDNYFAGTYECHSGQEAVRYLTQSLSNYGITEKTVQRMISDNQAYTLDNFVCFSCVNQSFMLHGEEQLSEAVRSAYLGFLLQDGTYLELVNMITGTYYSFTKE